MKVGYVRVSTKEQNTARQEIIMKEHGVEKIFIEKVSGKASFADRTEFRALMDFVREGDIIVVESISRFGRSIKEFLDAVEKLKNKKVEFVSVKENFETGTPAGRFMIVIFAALAELEREYIHERQAEGIAVAKNEGRFNGRPPKDLEDLEKTYQDWKNGKITATSASKKLGIARSTFYRRVDKYTEEKES